MSLKDFQVRSEVVAFRGGSLTFRGLSLNDVSYLIGNYMPEVTKLFQMYAKEEQREAAIAESMKFATTVVRETPLLVSELMVLVSIDDEADLGDAATRDMLLSIAKKLPLPVQVESIKKIFELTFEEAGGAKKFIDSVMEMTKVMAPTSKQD